MVNDLVVFTIFSMAMAWVIFIAYRIKKRSLRIQALALKYQQTIEASKDEIEFMTLQLAMMQEQFAVKASMECGGDDCGVRNGDIKTRY